jgi:hypothetical protein
LKALKEYCQRNGKTPHYHLFEQRILRPTLEGTDAPSLQELARALGLGEHQAANCLVTIRRIYQRLLIEEIRLYTSSEGEAVAEIQTLLSCLGRG